MPLTESSGVVRSMAGEAAEWAPNGRFGLTHHAATPSATAVLICSPILAEMQRNYRREVVLARVLAAAGMTTHRFHYRGTGNSADAVLTLDGMIEDGVAAAEGLAVDRLAVVGTRVGAMVAAAVADRLPVARVVVWEPVLDGDRLTMEILRTAAVGSLGSDSPADPEAVLNSAGRLDVLGETLDIATYQSLQSTSFETLRPHPMPPTLVLQVGDPSRSRRDFQQLVDRLDEEQPGAALQIVAGREVWWANPGGDDIHRSVESDPTCRALVEATRDWLRPDDR